MRPHARRLSCLRVRGVPITHTAAAAAAACAQKRTAGFTFEVGSKKQRPDMAAATANSSSSGTDDDSSVRLHKLIMSVVQTSLQAMPVRSMGVRACAFLRREARQRFAPHLSQHRSPS
jgi:hypothetical protein